MNFFHRGFGNKSREQNDSANWSRGPLPYSDPEKFGKALAQKHLAMIGKRTEEDKEEKTTAK